MVIMKDNSKMKLSDFVIKNPLSYVKPLVINIYHRKSVPGVGAYDPIY